MKKDYIEEFKKDYDYGINSENELFDKINNYFGCDLKKGNKKDYYDFIDNDNKIIMELKTRRCELNKYATTMISMSKINNFFKHHEEYKKILLFKFTNKFMYYELTEINKNYIKKGGRKDRGKMEYGLYYYIPIKMLIDFDYKQITKDVYLTFD